jgi:transposase
MLVEACGKANMKKAQVYEWHKRFRDGRASVNDDPRCGRPSTSTNDVDVERVRNAARSDRRKSIQEISAEVGISVGSVRSILHKDFKILVPKMPAHEHEETRVTLAGDLITMAERDADLTSHSLTFSPSRD